MRALELILSIVNVCALTALVAPRLRASRWLRLVAPTSTVIAVSQILIEGSRWQMVPAYLMAAAFLLVWLASAAQKPKRAIKRAGSMIAAVAKAAAMVLAGIVLAVSIALPTILPVFSFPKPTGQYKIGTVTYHWIDGNRPELFTTNPKEHREIVAQVWYPAVQTRISRRAPYIEDAGIVTPVLARLFHLPSFFFSYFRYVDTNAELHAPVVHGTARYPVLIYLSGLAGFRTSSMFQIQTLVSHGYIVVGLDQPGASAAVRVSDGQTISVLPRAQIQPLIDQSIDPVSSAPRLLGRPMPKGMLPYFAEDVRYAIDKLVTLDEASSGDILAERMDLHHIGVFGVSLGAMVAAEAAFLDSRIDATLMMDAAMPESVVRGGLQQPAMWMTRPASSMRLERSRSGGWTEENIAQTLSSMQAVFNAHKPGSAYYLDMPGMFHVDFTDLPCWSPITEQLGLTGPVDGCRMLAAINAYSLAFFDQYLKGAVAPLLEGLARQYPGVHSVLQQP